MAVPATVAASGYFQVTRAGVCAGEGTLRMRTSVQGTLSFGGDTWELTGAPATKKLHGTRNGSVLELSIVNRSRLQGTVEGDALELTRSVLRPIPAAEMAQFDPGPSGAIKAVMDATPDYVAEVGDTTTFWYAFGPVLYRGRLDGSARVLGIASDPGPTECLPFMRRTLVGDSGQKTQGFLAKLGLTRSYILVNAFAVAMRPGRKTKGMQVLRTNAAIMAARHALYDALLDGGLEAIVAFGEVAHEAYDIWAASSSAVTSVPVFKVAHPAAVDRSGSGDDAALKAWAGAVKDLREVVTPDLGGDPGGSNFGDYFTELDYVRIPRWDLPLRAPAYAGDDSWGRAGTPLRNNCCARPSPDDSVSLLLQPPPRSGRFLRYHYKDGKLDAARSKSGRRVKVDAFGIPL
ncbi:MAG TPA: hypothetical protein VFZ26_15530 [Gemmatimonadales bacterium]